jgi:FlaA1/EpsC-like NDP-sugar epimerase
MYEELNYNSEELEPTAHPKVFRLSATAPSLEVVTARLTEMENSFNQVAAEELKRLITHLVPEYTPLIKKPGIGKAAAPRFDLAQELAPQF